MLITGKVCILHTVCQVVCAPHAAPPCRVLLLVYGTDTASSNTATTAAGLPLTLCELQSAQTIGSCAVPNKTAKLLRT